MTPAIRATACLMVALGAMSAGCTFFESKEAVQPPERVDHFEKAVAYEREGAWEQAQAQYRLALKDNPDDSRSWVNLGRVYARAGQDASAVGCWRKAVEVNPSDAKAWNLLGGAAMRENDFPEALKDYTKAIESAPNDADLYYNAAIACRSMRRDADAATYYRRWLQLAPDAPGADADEARKFLEARGDE